MKRLLSAATIAVGAIWAGAVTPASATPVTITGTYTISETINDANGGAAITGTLGSGVVNSIAGTTGNFSFALTPGAGYTAPVNLALFSPDNNKCEGSGCSGGSKGTETDPFTIAFTFTKPSGAAATTDNATFTAKYALSYLACDPGGDGTGRSDCVSWGASPIVANFTDGAVLDIELNNASDWDISPTIAFSLIDGPGDPVPEPSSIALLGFGLLGVGFVANRKRG
jgi:hypothetical protein